jgi:hypothetical protein
MWQWATPLLAAGIWSKHGERAVACNARRMIASGKVTSLERQFMVLTEWNLSRRYAKEAVTEITAQRIRGYNQRLPVL